MQATASKASALQLYQPKHIVRVATENEFSPRARISRRALTSPGLSRVAATWPYSA